MITWNASPSPAQTPEPFYNKPSTFLDTALVCRFQGSYNPCPVETLTLRQALTTIRSDRYQYQIECLRATLATHGKGIYDHYKKLLDAYSFAGTFAPRRGKDCLSQSSGIVHLDYDGIADVQELLEVLCVEPAVSYGFVSPSASGAKIGVRVLPVADDHAYKHAWQHVAESIERSYGFVADPSGKDISRLCYASWDPHAYVNPEADVFPVPPMESNHNNIMNSSSKEQTLQGTSRTYATDRRQQYVDQAVARAVKIIETSYPAMPGMPGNRHHSRLKAARLLGGYVGGNLLSYDHAYTILEAVVVGHTIHLGKAMKTIADGLTYGARTPVTYEQLEQERINWCHQHGYTPQRAEGN